MAKHEMKKPETPKPEAPATEAPATVRFPGGKARGETFRAAKAASLMTETATVKAAVEEIMMSAGAKVEGVNVTNLVVDLLAKRTTKGPLQPRAFINAIAGVSSNKVYCFYRAALASQKAAEWTARAERPAHERRAPDAAKVAGDVKRLAADPVMLAQMREILRAEGIAL